MSSEPSPRHRAQLLAPADSPAAAHGGPKICLCMIVRNEAHVLERCLDAARPLIDAASLCDTGSQDGTAELAASWLSRRGIPGLVHHHEFRDFGHNRTLSILAAQETLRRFGFDLERCYL